MERTGKILNIQKFSINDGPGIRTTVFFKGCPLQCRWCSNPESQNRFASIADTIEDEAYCGKDYTVEQVMEEVRKDKPFYDQSGGGITLSGGEVLLQMEFARALCNAARAEGIHVAIETTGYAAPSKFLEFMDYVDLILYDFKHYDRLIHYAKTGVYNDIILENLRRAVAVKKPVIARIPVIPGFNEDLPTARKMAQTLADMGIQEVHLLPFHQFGEKKYQRLGVTYEMAGVKQLHPEDLESYQKAFLDCGLDCTFR
jgi:pyruvate formate lyase activating enzyme